MLFIIDILGCRCYDRKANGGDCKVSLFALFNTLSQKNSIMTKIAEKLIQVAAPIVQHYFTDVTEHDVAAVQKMQVGEYRLWSLRNTGTWLCSLAVAINTGEEKELLAPTIVGNAVLRNNSKKVCLVKKTDQDDCEIVETSYAELQYLLA